MIAEEKSTKIKLSILLRVDSLSFIAVDEKGNVHRHGSFHCPLYTNGVSISQAQLTDILSANDLLLPDQVSTINLDTPHFSFVPKGLFKFEDIESYFPVGDRDDLALSQSQSQVCLYKYPLTLRSLLSKVFPGAVVKHLAESFLIYLDSHKSEQAVIYLMQRDSRLYIVAFQDGRLQKFTHYQITDWRDVLYFYILATEVIDWRSSPQVRLNGDRSLVQELHPQLRERVEDLDIIEWTNGWRLPDSLVDPMQLFDLYCTHYANHSRRV